MASVFCDVNVPDFVQNDCGIEQGGIVAMAIIAGDQLPTIANLREASFWTTKLAASPQKYWKILDTKGSYPGGTPTEEEGFGRNATLRTGADHEATVMVLNVEDNHLFMAAINQSPNQKVVLVTNGGLAFYIEDASIYAKVVIDQAIKSVLRWELSIKWSDDLSNPPSFIAPSAIFG